MMAKALGLRQSITDGGIYTPDRVCWWDGPRPGLDTLSRQWGWAYRDRRGYRALGGRDWATGLPPQQDLDALALDHVREFWGPYDLPFPFTLEHKIGNTFHKAAYWSKADYGLMTAAGPVYALRGKDRPLKGKHPTYALLDAILSGEDEFPADLTYTRGGILKVGKYLLAQVGSGYDELKDLRPGDNLPEVEYEQASSVPPRYQSPAGTN